MLAHPGNMVKKMAGRNKCAQPGTPSGRRRMEIIDAGLYTEGFEFFVEHTNCCFGRIQNLLCDNYGNSQGDYLWCFGHVKDTSVMIVSDYIFLFTVIVFAIFVIVHRLDTIIIP